MVNGSDGQDVLPDLEAVRPRAYVDDDPAAVLRFSNGARLRYRAGETAIVEEWVPPASGSPARSHEVSTPTPHEGTAEPTTDGRPSSRALSDKAIAAVGSYLSFDSRTDAAFTWGEANVDVLFGDT